MNSLICQMLFVWMKRGILGIHIHL